MTTQKEELLSHPRCSIHSCWKWWRQQHLKVVNCLKVDNSFWNLCYAINCPACRWWQETIFACNNYYFASLDWAANSPCTPVLVQISLNTFRDTKSRTKQSELYHPVSHTLHTPRGQKEEAGCQSDQNPHVWVARRNTDSSSNIQHRNTLALSHTGRLWQPHLFTADPQSHCISCAVSAWQELELFPALPGISFCDAE